MRISYFAAMMLFECGLVVAHEGLHDPPPNAANSTANHVTIEERDGFRFIESNGIPDHMPGRFPNRGNPNSISPQRLRYRVPLQPKVAAQITKLEFGAFGVALNGVPFDPGTAEFWRGNPQSGWRYEALSGKINLGLDVHHAHVQPTGAYHYHGLPTGLIEKRTAGNAAQMTLLGYAADGFPIYGPKAHLMANDSRSELVEMKSSYRLKSGARPSGPGGAHDGTFVQDFEFVAGTGDLDECNGRMGVTPEYPAGTYYYVLTSGFPFIPRSYRGTPDSSFARRGPPPGGVPGGRRPPPSANGRRQTAG